MSPWKAIFTHTFERDIKKQSVEIQERILTTIKELLMSEDPHTLGHTLHGKWKGHYSYRIGLQYRLIYRVNLAHESIEFIAVGTHKVY